MDRFYHKNGLAMTPGYNLARRLKVHVTEPVTKEAMITHLKRYLKLKKEATKLMLSGDVERYMHKLRALAQVKPLAGSVTA